MCIRDRISSRASLQLPCSHHACVRLSFHHPLKCSCKAAAELAARVLLTGLRGASEGHARDPAQRS
eukprot:4846504-Lingulodinium_polyedra.AAC.1